jgi:hypothetical protein
MRKVLFGTTLFVFILYSAAFAQFGGKVQQGPKFYSEFKPVVGAWAEYQMKSQKETPTKMKIAIVGKEGDSWWYESVMEGQGRNVMKMLVSGDPNEKKGIKRMIMKSGNEQAVEMTGMMGKHPDKGTYQPKGKMIDKGMETITVPAGTFSAHHYQYQHEKDKDVVDSWVSEKVPPYGMVKSSSKDFEMVLTGYGTGAKTLITETPKKFEMPQMPAGMPKGMMPPGMGAPKGD